MFFCLLNRLCIILQFFFPVILYSIDIYSFNDLKFGSQFYLWINWYVIIVTDQFVIYRSKSTSKVDYLCSIFWFDQFDCCAHCVAIRDLFEIDVSICCDCIHFFWWKTMKSKYYDLYFLFYLVVCKLIYSIMIFNFFIVHLVIFHSSCLIIYLSDS